ncbi:MAG: galactokinase [Clostridia bacterium]|nr:galactokinase [Clostridia bacterium]
MKKIDIKTSDFLARLAVVYGDEASAQHERFFALAESFEKDFDCDADLRFFSAPGRTEVGGNHTDHNNGKVLAAAINLDAIAAVQARDDGVICVNSQGYAPITVDTANLNIVDDEAGKSNALIRGVCARFNQLGYKYGGFNASVTSCVLSGSGLSSSAAYEVLIGTILNYLYNDGKISSVEIAQISQYAENVYFKKPCGLMDQTACSVGGFVKIDFEDTSAPVIDKVDFDIAKHGYNLCIVDTGGNHADLTGDYAAIRLEMNSVAEYFGKSVLRQVDEKDVFANIGDIRKKTGDRAIERAIHFYNENKRVERLSKALSDGDFESFKSTIIESGKSSFMYNQNCFTLSAPESQPVALALCIAEELLKDSGAYRVHGGGFAGTIQAFVPTEQTEAFVCAMRKTFGENSCYILKVRSHGGCEI